MFNSCVISERFYGKWGYGVRVLALKLQYIF